MTNRATTASAPGKIILFGEHAVVYGRPALAVPVTQVQAVCRVQDVSAQAGVLIVAPDVNRRYRLDRASPDDPLAAAVRGALAALNVSSHPGLTLTVRSTIPIACGLGSGAAIATAIVRALAQHLKHPLPPAAVSDVVFEVEKIHHGTPSGIDNSVVAFARPIFFQKNSPIEPLAVGAPLTLVIGDTGVTSPTYKVVGDLRRRWQAEPGRYESYFDRMGRIALRARRAVERGDVAGVGQCMVDNHALLQEIGVSSTELDGLVKAAHGAGAAGAKLSGAGWGGNMIALAPPGRAEEVAGALRGAGAAGVIITVVR
ncbi:MAG: mevalonate kinase [Anaerolineae bacterium]